MEKILVTGGAGYIGSHTCKILAENSYEPITFDNLVYGHRWAVKWGPLEIGDINDRKRLNEVIEKYNPAAIIHFAAFAYIGESVEDPAKYYHNNVSGTLTLLDVMRENNINKIIFSSSCSTYGLPVSIPIKEDHSQKPINPYGFSKLIIERILEDYETAYGIKSVTLRYFNAAGADPDGEIGEDHDPETHLIPLVLKTAIRSNDRVTIFGDDYETTDGTCVRDYIHVTDLARAHLMALEYLNKENKSASFNLGIGNGYSVKDVIEASCKITGRKIKTKAGRRRSGDPPILVADSTLARKVLGWEPEFKTIEDLIATAWKWFQKHN